MTTCAQTLLRCLNHGAYNEILGLVRTYVLCIFSSLLVAKGLTWSFIIAGIQGVFKLSVFMCYCSCSLQNQEGIPPVGKYLNTQSKGLFTQVIFVAATQCNFYHAIVASSFKHVRNLSDIAARNCIENQTWFTHAILKLQLKCNQICIESL